jgi:hypothetical protein
VTGITTSNLTNGLMALIKQLQYDDLATVEALLGDMTGNRVAAMMLRQLMRWWPKASNPDGWVYKSHQDWWAELRIKQSELPAANGALERVGVVIQLRKAEGAPTKHYRLDLKQFWKVLALTLHLSAKKLAAMLKNAFSDSSKKDLVNGAKSITTNPSTKPSTELHAVLLDTAIEEAKKVPGISDATARRMVGNYGPERVTAAAKLICSKLRTNPAGALVIALRDQWECQPSEAQIAHPQEQVDAAKYADDIPGSVELPREDIYDAPPGFPPAGLPEEAGDDTQPVAVPLPDPNDVPTEPDEDEAKISQPNSQIWARIAEQCEVQMGRAVFDACLRGVTFDHADPTGWVLAAPNRIAADLLNLDRRIKRDVERIAELVTGAPVMLRFEARKVVRA